MKITLPKPPRLPKLPKLPDLSTLPVLSKLPRPPAESDFRSPAHDERVTSRIGVWLGTSFTVCFVTGLLSHLIQHPPSWFLWPSAPVALYRITQGLHVISGVAAIPLLFAKLWSVFPKLFSRPLVRSLLHLVERGSILLLSASAFFELLTGIVNVAQNYAVLPFYFPTVHYAVAWVAIGSIAIHVAVKLPVIRRGLGASTAPAPDDRPDGALSRRGYLRGTAVLAGTAVVATAGATVPLLSKVSALSWKAGAAPQDVPVNRTAAAAGIAYDPSWKLAVVTAAGTRTFSLDELNALPQTTAELPISCVEGWSTSATWTGVAIPDLLRAVGAQPGADLRVESMEKVSLYRVSVLPGEHTGNAQSLLALRLNGNVLAPDHGYPCRIIAPSRPGVLQTKWVGKLEVLS